MQLLTELVLSGVMVCLTLMTHVYGLGAIRLATKSFLGGQPRRGTSLHSALLVGAGLLAVHGLEIWQYALVFWGVGATPDLESALYFTISTYSTVGYGDLVLPVTWRVFGAIEGINGIVLLGWSTAFLVTGLQHARASDSPAGSL